MLPAKSAQVYDYKEQRTRGEGGRLLVDGGGRCLNQRPEKQVPPLGLKSSVGMTIGRGANGEQRTAKSEERRATILSLQIHDLERRRGTDLQLEAGLLQRIQNIWRGIDQRNVPGKCLAVVQPPELQRIKLRQVEQQTLVQVRVGRRLECAALLLEIRRQQQNAIVGTL